MTYYLNVFAHMVTYIYEREREREREEVEERENERSVATDHCNVMPQSEHY